MLLFVTLSDPIDIPAWALATAPPPRSKGSEIEEEAEEKEVEEAVELPV